MLSVSSRGFYILDIEASDINSSLGISVFALMSIKDASEIMNFLDLNMKIRIPKSILLAVLFS